LPVMCDAAPHDHSAAGDKMHKKKEGAAR